MAGRCSACHNPLTAESTDPVSTRHCRACGQRVWAVRPDDQVDAWFEVVVPAGPVVVDGARFMSAQCGECGLGEFTLRRISKAWDAICAGQWWDGEWHDGCHAAHPVRLKMRCEVQ